MRGRRRHALLPDMVWLTVTATGGNFYAVREPELGVATTDVQQVVLEVVQQVRGECGERQVAGVELGLVHSLGAGFATQATTILGTEATL